MAERWVALLRGINLGARNRVAMADLRRVFEAAGCTDVATYIQSGNVVFSSRVRDHRALGRKLERAIADELGVETRVVVRTGDELREVIDANPFGADTSQTHVAFLAEKPAAAAIRALEAEDVAPDELEVAGHDVFLRFPNGVQGARLSGALLERRLGVPGTVRNWRTVERLATLL